MDSRDLTYVLTVRDTQNFSKAAQRLFISQPSLSAAVKKAEKQIGFPIFDRSSNHIQLTELGKEYIRSIAVSYTHLTLPTT